MCGIVGAVAERNITAILIEGLKRLEYRGYDSAGLAVLTAQGVLERRRRIGKVSELEAAVAADPLAGQLGIAHTRWLPTVRRPNTTLTRTSPAMMWRSFTMASSRTMKPCVKNLRAWAMSSPRKPIQKSSCT